MKPVVSKACPAAVALLRQATAINPLRIKASDGLLPSVKHQLQNPNSDHNSGLAVDISHDPAHGFDAAELFEKFKADCRVDYLIYNEQIWSKAKSKQGNRKYSGLNPHHKHIHISIKQEFSQDASPWFPWMNQPKKVNKIISQALPIARKKANKTQGDK